MELLRIAKLLLVTVKKEYTAANMDKEHVSIRIHRNVLKQIVGQEYIKHGSFETLQEELSECGWYLVQYAREYYDLIQQDKLKPFYMLKDHKLNMVAAEDIDKEYDKLFEDDYYEEAYNEETGEVVMKKVIGQD